MGFLFLLPTITSFVNILKSCNKKKLMWLSLAERAILRELGIILLQTIRFLISLFILKIYPEFIPWNIRMNIFNSVNLYRVIKVLRICTDYDSFLLDIQQNKKNHFSYCNHQLLSLFPDLEKAVYYLYDFSAYHSRQLN